MASAKLCLFLLLALLALAQCNPVRNGRVRRNMNRGRPVWGLVPRAKKGEYIVDATGTQGFLTQKLDHFKNSSASWQQRYWYSKDYYKTGGPAFIMLGGEGPEDPYWIEDSSLTWTTIAKQTGAFVFILEHRFYGDSKPTPDMSTSNLQYLSSVQAVEDTAVFIQNMKTKFPQLAASKWVAFGGSYSGALAAWVRIKHPELVSIAVATSGPVQAEVDFVEYLEVVKNSISVTNAFCGAQVGAAFNQVAQLVQTATGRKTLKNTFQLCEDIDPTNAMQLETFWSTVYSPYMEIVQYSGDAVSIFQSELTINHAICRFYTDNSTSLLTKLTKVNNYFNQVYGYQGCNDIDYDGFIQFMKQTSYGDAQSDRAWVWQTCTEFGYYQSTDSTTAGSYFGGMGSVPVSYYIDQCYDIYGSSQTANSINAAIAATNKYYGGRDNIVSDHILFPNGDIDPWHALGKLTSNNGSTLMPVVIHGTAHCADMYAPASTDLPALTSARQLIINTVVQWLSQLN